MFGGMGEGHLHQPGILILCFLVTRGTTEPKWPLLYLAGGGKLSEVSSGKWDICRPCLSNGASWVLSLLNRRHRSEKPYVRLLSLAWGIGSGRGGLWQSLPPFPLPTNASPAFRHSPHAPPFPVFTYCGFFGGANRASQASWTALLILLVSQMYFMARLQHQILALRSVAHRIGPFHGSRPLSSGTQKVS